jgi:predicted nucleotide-binding protein
VNGHEVAQRLDASLGFDHVPSPRVFVVHGHDQATREAVARFLERLELEPVILHEQANEGMTIIEKLERHSDVRFAVVLLTPDDEGRSLADDSALRPRARQNVLLELGYFTGKLGRRAVCALHQGALELPSDYLGVVYVPIDEGGGWQLRLAKELKAAGFTIDMNKAL